MAMRVAVAGGTGLVGTHVVRELRSRGHEAVVLARAEGVDLMTGEGLDAALAGADAVIDVTNTTAMRRAASTAFLGEVTEQLLGAERRAGVGHHLALSIVGIDGLASNGYYAGKLRQEEVIDGGDVPATILRATQFHEFLAEIIRRTSRGPIALVPRMRSQPIAAREVAVALVDAVLQPPAGRLPDLAGPQVEDTVTLARRLLRARGRRPLVAGVRPPGAAGRAMARGALLPATDGPRGRETFDEWLRGADGQRWRDA